MGGLAARALEHQERIEGAEQRASDLEKDARAFGRAQAKLLKTQEEGYVGEVKELASDCSQCLKQPANCCWCDCREFSDK